MVLRIVIEVEIEIDFEIECDDEFENCYRILVRNRTREQQVRSQVESSVLHCAKAILLCRSREKYIDISKATKSEEGTNWCWLGPTRLDLATGRKREMTIYSDVSGGATRAPAYGETLSGCSELASLKRARLENTTVPAMAVSSSCDVWD